MNEHTKRVTDTITEMRDNAHPMLSVNVKDLLNNMRLMCSHQYKLDGSQTHTYVEWGDLHHALEKTIADATKTSHLPLIVNDASDYKSVIEKHFRTIGEAKRVLRSASGCESIDYRISNILISSAVLTECIYLYEESI